MSDDLGKLGRQPSEHGRRISTTPLCGTGEYIKLLFSRNILWMVSHRDSNGRILLWPRLGLKAIRGMARIQIIQNSKRKSKNFGR